jgi:hypothetical protein
VALNTIKQTKTNFQLVLFLLFIVSHSMDSDMEQKYYQALKTIEDIEGSKLLVFQVYLINLGGQSCPRLCRKKESPKSEDTYNEQKKKDKLKVCFCLFDDHCLSFLQLPMHSVPIRH